jgi:hypothetical protein
MTLEEAVRVFTRLASALEHAHFAGVYHRDLKPANVVLCHDGSVRLVDFGIAATQSAEPLTGGGHLGTISYVPPEVFRSEKADPRAADVYAFGLLLHEALVGKRMFPVERGLSPAAAAASVGTRKLDQKPFDPGEGVPERVREIVRKATDGTPSSRPDMTSVRKALVSLRERRGQVDAAERTPIPGSVPMPIMKSGYEEHTMRVPEPARQAEDEGAAAHRVRQRPQRRRLTPVLAGLGGLLLLGGIAVGLSRSDGDRPLPDKVQASEPREPAAATPAPAPMITIPTPIPARRSTVPAATPAVPPVTGSAVPAFATPLPAPATQPPAAGIAPQAAPTAPPAAGTAPRAQAPAPVQAGVRPSSAPSPRAVTPPPAVEDDSIPSGSYRPPSPSVDVIEVQPEIDIEPEPEPEPEPPGGAEPR